MGWGIFSGSFGTEVTLLRVSTISEQLCLPTVCVEAGSSLSARDLIYHSRSHVVLFMFMGFWSSVSELDGRMGRQGQDEVGEG